MRKRSIWKETTTWIGIVTGAIAIVLTICVYKGVLTGTEYAAALAGVGTFATTLIGIVVRNNQQP